MESLQPKTAAGALIGAGAGAAAGALLAGGVTASTGAVVSGANMLAVAVSTGGVSAGLALVSENVSQSMSNVGTVCYIPAEVARVKPLQHLQMIPVGLLLIPLLLAKLQKLRQIVRVPISQQHGHKRQRLSVTEQMA